LLGFGLASFGAAMALAVMAFSTGAAGGAAGGIQKAITAAFGISGPLTLAVAVLSAVPALLVIQYAESKAIRSFMFYVATGGVTALVAYWIAHATETVPLESSFTFMGAFAFVISGLAFGAVYWFFSGRYAGRAQTAD
jgi:hypothetical protein